MASGNGTSHYKLHGLLGYGLIIGLPFALYSGLCAATKGATGFIGWLSNPVGGLGFLAFFTAAIWYCTLEMEEVVMDYFDGGLRRFSLLTFKLVAIVAWLALTATIYQLAF